MEFEKNNQLGCVKCSLFRIQGNGKKTGLEILLNRI